MYVCAPLLSSPLLSSSMASASASASACRDRTSEFRSLTQTLKKIEGLPLPTHPHPQPQPLPPTSASEFNKKASRIASAIHETSNAISRLAHCNTKSSMFNDPTVEIQELTALIKNDIMALNSALSDLQAIQGMEVADGIHSHDTIVHSTAVCDDLKGKLMGATKRLQDVLTASTQNMKAHENRRQIFSKKASRDNPFHHPPKPVTVTVTQPPPWSNASHTSHHASSSLSNEAAPSHQLRRRLATDNTPTQQMEMSMMQQVVPRQESYNQSRATALHSVESTITELSGIFTHLATMVAHQRELAIRIDDSMDESLANVEGAHSSLLKHLSRISSNRWLLIKIFAILILFLLIFIFFVA